MRGQRRGLASSHLVITGRDHARVESRRRAPRADAEANRLERMVRLALIADKLASVEWNAQEALRMLSIGDSMAHTPKYSRWQVEHKVELRCTCTRKIAP